MNKAYLTVGIILLSIVALGAINLIQNYSTGNELDYYMLKEAAQASMSDAVDPAYPTENGTLRIDKEKFAESFVLRFANAVQNDRNYDIYIYDINEIPPKVSIKVKSQNKSLTAGDGQQAMIVTQIDAILMSNNKNDAIATNLKKNED